MIDKQQELRLLILTTRKWKGKDIYESESDYIIIASSGKIESSKKIEPSKKIERLKF